MYPFQEIAAHRASTQIRSGNLALAQSQAPRSLDASRNRSEATVVVPAQKRNDAIGHFLGAKAGELLTGFGLGYAVGMGEPLFMTDAADPSKGFGLVPVVAAFSNVLELVMLWTGWTPFKTIGGNVGLFLDGGVRGVAGASHGIFWYTQGNMLALAKGGLGTPGVSTLGMNEYPQMNYAAPANGGGLGVGAGYAPPANDHPAPLHAPKVQQARQAVNDPHAFFF